MRKYSGNYNWRNMNDQNFDPEAIAELPYMVAGEAQAKLDWLELVGADDIKILEVFDEYGVPKSGYIYALKDGEEPQGKEARWKELTRKEWAEGHEKIYELFEDPDLANLFIEKKIGEFKLDYDEETKMYTGSSDKSNFVVKDFVKPAVVKGFFERIISDHQKRIETK